MNVEKLITSMHRFAHVFFLTSAKPIKYKWKAAKHSAAVNVSKHRSTSISAFQSND
jgi:hypothetical protein